MHRGKKEQSRKVKRTLPNVGKRNIRQEVSTKRKNKPKSSSIRRDKKSSLQSRYPWRKKRMKFSLKTDIETTTPDRRWIRGTNIEKKGTREKGEVRKEGFYKENGSSPKRKGKRGEKWTQNPREIHSREGA